MGGACRTEWSQLPADLAKHFRETSRGLGRSRDSVEKGPARTIKKNKKIKGDSGKNRGLIYYILASVGEGLREPLTFQDGCTIAVDRFALSGYSLIFNRILIVTLS